MGLAANSLEGKAEAYLTRLEKLLEALDHERESSKLTCQEVRQDIKEIYIEARDQGVPVKSLKQIVKYRQLERRQQALSAGLNIDEASAYATLVDVLGELGMAAAKRAGYAPANQDGYINSSHQ